MKTIIFKTDGGNIKNLSYGHFYRCLEISCYLKKKYKIIFFLSIKDKIVEKNLKKNNFDFFYFREKKFLLRKIEKINPKFVVEDVPKPELNSLKKKIKLITVDDFCNFKKNTNYYLTSNFNKKPRCKYEFIFQTLELRLYKFLNTKYNKKKNYRKVIKNVLLLSGGSDIKNLKRRVLNKFISEYDSSYKFTSSYQLDEKLSKYKFLNIFTHEKIYKNINNYDLAITNGGNTFFELIKLGIPCLGIPTNKVEKDNLNFIEKKYFHCKFNFSKKMHEQLQYKHINIFKKKKKKFLII